MFRFFLCLFLACSLLAPAPVPAGPVSSVRVAFLGDFLPAGSADPVIKSRGYGHLFAGVKHILDSTDAVVLNLETPISTRGKAIEGKTYTFRASPRAAGGMAASGVKAVWLANNHILDFGVEALDDTIGHLERAGIAHAGAGCDVAAAACPAVLDFSAMKVSLLSFSNTFPDSYWAQKNRPGTFFGAPGPVGRAVRQSVLAGDGPVVTSFHWGAELMADPKEYQEDLARLAIDAGAALVVGHHPHIPQRIDLYMGVPILYSLGNFSFGSYSGKVREGLLVVAQFGEGGRCERLEVYPINVNNHEVQFSPRPIGGSEGQRVFKVLTEGVDRTQAEIQWDGEKGLIIPK